MLIFLLFKEIGAMRNCMNEAFWYRSIPCGSASALAALFLIKTGKINPQIRYRVEWGNLSRMTVHN